MHRLLALHSPASSCRIHHPLPGNTRCTGCWHCTLLLRRAAFITITHCQGTLDAQVAGTALSCFVVPHSSPTAREHSMHRLLALHSPASSCRIHHPLPGNTRCTGCWHCTLLLRRAAFITHCQGTLDAQVAGTALSCFVVPHSSPTAREHLMHRLLALHSPASSCRIHHPLPGNT